MTDSTREPTGQAHLDLEHLAAYLDGTLPPSERAATERTLAVSPEAREILAEAMRLLGYEDEEAEEEVAVEGKARAEPGAVEAGRAPARQAARRRWVVPTLAAAAVVAISLVPILRSGSSPDGLSEAERLLRGAPSIVGEGWDRHAWTVTRSKGSTLPTDRAAFRVGVGWTDALVAWQAGAPADASAHFAAIGVILEGVPLGSPAARVAAELVAAVRAGRSPEDARALVREGRARVDALLPSRYLELGERIESVRLAARSGAVEFLRDPETRAGLERGDMEGLPADAAASLEEVRAILEGDLGSEARTVLSGVLDRLLTQLGG